MNINNILNITTRISKNGMPNFKSNIPKIPETPNDSFECTIQSPAVTEIKDLIEGDEAFKYYLASTDVGYDAGMLTYKAKNLGDKAALMDTIVLFGTNRAVDLGKQPVFQNLNDGESVEITSSPNNSSKADYKLSIPQAWFSNATIVKHNGDYIISNYPSNTGVISVARKSKLAEDTERNTKYINPIPQRQAEYYYREFYMRGKRDEKYRNQGYNVPDSDFLLPKNESVPLCEMSDLGNTRHFHDVIVLSSKKNGYVAFNPAFQRGLADLKEGEKVIVGRYEPDAEDNGEKRIDVPPELSYPTISYEHLLFENKDGKLCVTDISRNGAAKSNTRYSMSEEEYNKYFAEPGQYRGDMRLWC